VLKAQSRVDLARAYLSFRLLLVPVDLRFLEGEETMSTTPPAWVRANRSPAPQTNAVQGALTQTRQPSAQPQTTPTLATPVLVTPTAPVISSPLPPIMPIAIPVVPAILPAIQRGRARGVAFYDLESSEVETTRRIKEKEFEFPAKASYKPDRLFLDFLRPIQDFGWKLHVVKPQGLGVTSPNLPQGYLQLLDFLFQSQIPHKIVGSLAFLEEMERNPSQIGKFITIYPKDTQQLILIADLIDNYIPKNTNRIPEEDMPVGSNGVTGARWGGLTSPYTVAQDGGRIKDDRKAGPFPAWVKNPFDPLSKGIDAWGNFAKS
jgi:hypothetical protein